ncbi:MAG: AhpC/TSA family protein [Chitinophagaceae bacterium]|nr:AhpC/TSA family protein [Chitinophagaceae bacterium]
MKKLSWLVVIALLWSACAKNDKTKVSGTIKNMGNGEIYFIKSGDDKIMDTVKVTNDQFSYELKVTEPTVYMVNFGAEQLPAFVILENVPTTINYEMNVLNSLQVKGGPEQEVYNSFINECRRDFNSMDSISKVAESNAQNQVLLAELQKSFFTLDSVVKVKQIAFVNKNPKSIASAFLAVNYLSQNPEKTYEEVSNVYNTLDKSIQQTYYGKKLEEMATQMRSTSEGQVAPDFTLNDVNDKPVALSSFRGKVVLLDFWASWCGPCRKENPNVVAAYNKFHSKGLEILGVSLDDNKSNWQQAIAKDGLTWTHVSDLEGWQSKAAQLYGVQSIPANFLLDKDGKIIAKDLRGEMLEQKLNTLFP